MIFRVILIWIFIVFWGLMFSRNASGQHSNIKTGISPDIVDCDSLTNVGSYAEALECLVTKLRNAAIQKSAQDYIYLLLRLGVNFELSGKYTESSQVLVKALQMSDDHDIETYKSEILINLGILNFDINQPEKALLYYHKAYTESLKNADTLGVIRALNNSGNTYLTLIGNADSAFAYFQPAYQLAVKVDYQSAMMAIGGNLAQLHLLRKEYQKAEQLANQLLAIDSLNPYFHFTKAMVYKERKEFGHALSSCQIAYSITDYAEFRMAILQEMAQISLTMSDPGGAFDYLSQYSALKDSINSVEIAEHISSLEAEYENEKKLRRISELENESLSRGKRIQGLTFIIIALILLAGGLMVWFRSKRKVDAQRAEAGIQRLKRLEAEAETSRIRSYIEGEEAERERLSAEIHDGIGGLLTGIRLKVAAISANDEFQSRLPEVAEDMLLAATELRRISRNLYPQTLVQSGLKSACEELVSWCKKQFDTPTLFFHFTGKDSRIDAMIEKNVFRIIQELLNNALKHSLSSQIDIELVIDAERIWLSVNDNGTGFDSGAVSYGQGLRSMQDRVLLMKGSLDIESHKGTGTCVTMEIRL